MSDLFWSRVDRAGGPEACWPWFGALSAGYGKFWADGRVHRAHRYAYLLTHDEVPPLLDHLCHTAACAGGPDCPHRRCCNPAHLRPATPKENIANGRRGAPTHCVHGHEFTAENTNVLKDGRRQCRTCVNERRRRYWAEGRIGKGK